MTLYFLLGTLTEEGQKMLNHNPNLMVDVVVDYNCDGAGAGIMGQYAVLGKYDFVMMAEASDNEAVARLSLEIGVRAGLHIEMLPALPIGVVGEKGPDQLEGGAEVARRTHEGPDQWQLPDRAGGMS
jgi:uncharacterized protein with GYD domain